MEEETKQRTETSSSIPSVSVSNSNVPTPASSASPSVVVGRSGGGGGGAAIAPLSTSPPSSSSTSAGRSNAGNTLPADALDYFSETAAKLGTGSSTGVMIQSPDGRPAGIFFHPRTNVPSSTSSSINNGVTPFIGGETGTAAKASGAAGMGSGGVGMTRRGSSDDRYSPSASSSARPFAAGANRSIESTLKASGTSSGVSSPRSNQSSSPNEAPVAGISTTHGNIFTPQVGLHSILSSQRPLVATPLVPQGDGEGVMQSSIPLSELADKTASSTSSQQAAARAGEGKEAMRAGGSLNLSNLPETVKGDRAEKDDAQPRSPIESEEPLSLSATLSPTSESKQALARSQSRKSFGALDAGSAAVARQTFGSGLPSSATARPSAQPQAGLLIGAGFSQPRRKGSLGAKRAATSIEVLPPIKVLIVEDNPINVKILSTFLKKRTIKYGVARDGREAVREWQTGGYHLILMDIQLPVMDGIEATKEIRRLEQEANIGPLPAATPSLASSSQQSAKELGGPHDAAPMAASGTTSPLMMLQNSLRASVIIVALTASVLNSDRVAALAAGCNDFLNKPVDLPWLERKVIEWGSMQYLISFREGPGDPVNGRSTHGRKAAGGLRKTYLSPTQGEVARSEGLVDRAFNAGPDQLARELAGKLYIGKKGRMEPSAAAAVQTAAK